ncbi:MAG: SDH family Clp fold serine proteinase [Conexivisphaera sp.]
MAARVGRRHPMGMLGYLFWMLLLAASASPLLSIRSRQRVRVIALLERKCGHRAITMIHRQERLVMLGVPI